MAEKAQTSKENPKEEKEKTSEEETSEETAEEKETPEEPKKEPEKKPSKAEETISKSKFVASQKESLRLVTALKKHGIDPKTGEKIEKEEKPEEEKSEEAKTIKEIVDKAVEEKVAPFTIEQERERVDKWLETHPESYDYLKQIEDNYIDTPGANVEAKLENALLIAKKDAMKEAGKKEMAFSIYQKEQAVVSGGGVSSTGAESALPPLSEEEKKVARSLGLKEDTYAKRRLQSKHRK